MRIVVFGAGAIGGVIGARLFQSGSDVTFVARGDNFRALSKDGIRLETRDESVTLNVPVVERAADLTLGADDVVILTVKSQDTRSALVDLTNSIPRDVAIVCAQNGVENERLALRSFANVYGMCVMCPATHLTPGVVQADSTPVTGLLDVGRWPGGLDDRVSEIAKILGAATFDSVARSDIERWKWGKLLLNLGNAVQAVCGTDVPAPEVTRSRRKKAYGFLRQRVSRTWGATKTLLAAAICSTPRIRAGEKRGGGSTWQSLMRGAGAIETDYLTGEIVLRGRLHGVATPVNELLQRLANQLAVEREHRVRGVKQRCSRMLE